LQAPESANCNLIANNADDGTCDVFQPLFCMTATVDDDACPTKPLRLWPPPLNGSPLIADGVDTMRRGP
jgi:hypothetical protein